MRLFNGVQPKFDKCSAVFIKSLQVDRSFILLCSVETDHLKLKITQLKFTSAMASKNRKRQAEQDESKFYGFISS